MKVKLSQSSLTPCNPHGLYSPWNSPGQNTAVGSLSLLQGIFPTQGSNPGLLQCRRILYQLSHKGSPRILQWVAYPFLQGIFLTHEWNQGLLHCRQILYQLSCQGKHYWLLLMCKRVIPAWFKSIWFPILASELHIIPSRGTSLAIQWLGFWASTVAGQRLIPAQGTQIPHAR